MNHETLTALVILLLVSCFVSTIAKRLRQPYTIALVLAGMLVALTKLTPHMHITHDVIFNIILPPLLFVGAMHMDLEQLKINWKPIAMLAIPGVVISTLLIGFMVHWLLGLDLMIALLFGALITPTDPISVLSILKEVGAPERLRTILEGESLFNDGTGVVVFTLLIGILTGHEQFSFGGTLSKFLIVSGGGTLVGLVCGFVAYKALKQTDEHLHEIAISIVLAFGTPLLAEHFHLSGIIAVVVAGLIMGNFGTHYSMSPRTKKELEDFWEVIEFVINSILFLVIGVELQVISSEQWGSVVVPVLIVIGTLLLSRAIVVYPIVWLKNIISRNDIPMAWSHVLFWGGLKGSISIALVVGLPESIGERELFLKLAFAVVLFTLVVQGLSIKPLAKKLQISDETH